MKFGGLTPTHVFKFELVVEKTSFGRMIVIFNEHGEQTFRKSCSPDELQDVLSPLRVQYVHNL